LGDCKAARESKLMERLAGELKEELKELEQIVNEI
jgi:hypothetical protein